MANIDGPSNRSRTLVRCTEMKLAFRFRCFLLNHNGWLFSHTSATITTNSQLHIHRKHAWPSFLQQQNFNFMLKKGRQTDTKPQFGQEYAFIRSNWVVICKTCPLIISLTYFMNKFLMLKAAEWLQYKGIDGTYFTTFEKGKDLIVLCTLFKMLPIQTTFHELSMLTLNLWQCD